MGTTSCPGEPEGSHYTESERAGGWAEGFGQQTLQLDAFTLVQFGHRPRGAALGGEPHFGHAVPIELARQVCHERDRLVVCQRCKRFGRSGRRDRRWRTGGRCDGCGRTKRTHQHRHDHRGSGRSGKARDIPRPTHAPPGCPLRLAFSRDGSRLYVALAKGKTLQVFDVARFEPIAEYPIGDRCWHFSFTPDDKHILAACGRSNEVVILEAGGKLVNRIPEKLQPWGLVTWPKSFGSLDTP